MECGMGLVFDDADDAVEELEVWTAVEGDEATEMRWPSITS